MWFHPYLPFHPFPLHPFHPFHPYGKPGVLYDPDEHPTNATVANIKMVRCMTQSYAARHACSRTDVGLFWTGIKIIEALRDGAQSETQNLHS